MSNTDLESVAEGHADTESVAVDGSADCVVGDVAANEHAK